MKKKFSKKWISSIQPRKQRKYRINAPIHIKHKIMSANLNKSLRKKYGRRSLPLRIGDKVRIMRGEFKNRSGKIDGTNLKKIKTSIEGINRSKKDGKKIKIWFEPSNLQILEINLEDKKRKEYVEKNLENKKIKS